MKKMIMLCIIPCIVYAIVIASSMLLPTQLSYPFKVTKGDSKVMEDIGYHVSFRTNLSGTGKNASIELKNKNGRITNTKKYHDYLLSNYEIDHLKLYNPVTSSYKDLPQWNSTDSTCKRIVDEIETLRIKYKIQFESNGGDFIGMIVNNKNQQYILDTGLQYKGDQNQKLYAVKYTCEEQEIFVDAENYIVYNRDDFNDGGLIEAQQDDKNSYYFLPKTNESFYGQNKIYRINIKQKSSVEYPEYKGEVKEVAKLPENRFYSQLRIMNDKLGVLAYGEEGSYLMLYEKDGTFLKEMKIPEDKEQTEFYGDGKYVFPIIDNTIYVIDSETMEIVEQASLPEEQIVFEIEDITYQNETLYVLYDQYKWKESAIDDGVIRMLLNQNIVLHGYKKGNVIFEGVQNLYTQDREKEEAAYLNLINVEFERGDIS